MDENETELLKLLYTRIGMTMEDASILAIDLGSPSSQFDPVKIVELKKSIATISKLMDAAQSIAE